MKPMVLGILNKETNSVVSAATIIAVLSLVSRLVGFVRDRILAGAFGAGPTLDAYYAAFKIPDFLFGLIVVGSLSASFIPIFTKYYRKKTNEDAAWRFTNNVLHVVVGLLVLAAVVVAFFAEPVAGLIAPGFSADLQQLTAEFMRIMLFAQVLLGASMVFGSVLQGMKRFFFYSLSPILYNAGIIVGALWLVDMFGPLGLAWGVVLGASMHLFIQLIGVFHAGYRYRPVVRLRTDDMREMGRLTGPRMLAVAMNHVNFVLFTVIASTLAVGSVTMFQFAYNIQFFPIGIFAISYAIAAFPTFTQHWEAGHTKRFVHAFSHTVRQVLFLIIPMTVVFFILRAQIVRVVVGAGQFDWSATIQTADTLGLFALSFVFQALIYIVVRAFFAMHDTVTPLVAGLAGAVIGFAVAWWVSRAIGVAGLGFAYSVAAFAQLVFLWIPLRRRVGDLDEPRILQSVFVMISAAIFCGLTIQLLKPVAVALIPLTTFLGVFVQGAFSGGIGLLVYVAVAYMLKSEELEDVLSGLKRRFFRAFEPKEPISTDPSQ